MARVYRCDSCEKVIDNVYTARMKEFIVGYGYILSAVIPENAKRKVKVHLCDDCYKGLHLIAQKVRAENE